MTHPIFVTGPQRAGSRLTSHIIARQTGRTFIDELDYSPDIPMNSVIQAPFLLKAVIELSFLCFQQLNLLLCIVTNKI